MRQEVSEALMEERPQRERPYLSIVATARNDDHGRALLEAFKFPLRSDR